MVDIRSHTIDNKIGAKWYTRGLINMIGQTYELTALSRHVVRRTNESFNCECGVPYSTYLDYITYLE